MRRREFIQQATCAAAGVTVLTTAAHSQPPSPQQPAERCVGIQIAPYNLMDEGLERCLDQLQRAADINTLLCYSHTYHIGYNTPPQVMAQDHGIEVRDMRQRNLPRVWVRHDPKRYRDSIIKHQVLDSRYEYHNRDLFAELIEPARERGMKIHARILEAGMSRAEFLPGYEQVAAIDLDGKKSHGPCWNHPAYRQWLQLSVEEMLEQYPLDGLQYGAERVGALSETLFRGIPASCFCSYCLARNQSKGIDAVRAKQGYRELDALIRSLEAGHPPPADGVLVQVFSIMMEYPEVLSWYREWLHADLEIGKLLSETVKRVRPSTEFGAHIDHQRSSWDIFYRAAIRYSEIASYCDYVKPILYHDILGPRLRWWVVEEMNGRVFSDFTREQTLAGLYAILGHDPAEQPNLAALPDRGLGPDYVYRETKRCVDGVAGAAKVYSGIGLDVPWHAPQGLAPFASDPEVLYQSCCRAIDAGADGLIASREYEEMRISSLEAFGRALRTS